MSGRRGRNEKVGIALAGGGPLGGIYEIGALVALEEALLGVATDLDSGRSAPFGSAATGSSSATGPCRRRLVSRAHCGIACSPWRERWANSRRR